MGNPKGFIEIERKEGGYRPINERIFDYGEVEQTLNENDRKDQASRCMDCGIPFCHSSCPVESNIVGNGMRHTIYFMQPIVFLSLQVAFVQRHARNHAC